MAIVTGLTAERIVEKENEAVVYGRMESGNLILTTQGGVDINVGPVGGGGGGVGAGDFASLNTVGIGRAVFIANGGSVPAGTPDYTIIVELPGA